MSNHHVPEYGISLVRERTLTVESKLATDPAAVAAIARAQIGAADREHFVVMLLNARQLVIGVNTVSIGTLTASLVHPREMYKPAILASAAGIVCAHNHPSGDTRPSPEDNEATKRIQRAGEILGITLVDHVIIGPTVEAGHFSFRQGGLLQ